jgi:hypothetical protein
MTWYRHVDPRYPFLWESTDQPEARWHGRGEGPAHYLCDTPDGAWAEYLRHEAIRDPADLVGVRRSLWAIEELAGLADLPELAVEDDLAFGGLDAYEQCRERARMARQQDGRGFRTRSAALMEGAAGGWRVDGGIERGRARDGVVVALFGRQPDLTGWSCSQIGSPDPSLLQYVRALP